MPSYARHIASGIGRGYTKTGRHRHLMPPCVQGWCPGRDLNSYGINHTPLKRARLPVPPPGHYMKTLFRLHHALYDCCERLSIAFRQPATRQAGIERTPTAVEASLVPLQAPRTATNGACSAFVRFLAVDARRERNRSDPGPLRRCSLARVEPHMCEVINGCSTSPSLSFSV